MPTYFGTSVLKIDMDIDLENVRSRVEHAIKKSETETYRYDIRLVGSKYSNAIEKSKTYDYEICVMGSKYSSFFCILLN